MSEDLEDFLRRFGDYLAKANESKKRGNNDYNPLKAVQNPHDEVNMHSGFIYSLLDTNGAHYQDDLFLSLFLEVLGLKEWFDGTKNAKVEKEPQRIDLYIHNDTKHIIIENKINAKDQPNQIATLIQSVKESGVEYENIFVVFLTLHDREPCENSRTNKDNKLLWEIKGGFLESKEGEKINRVGYKKVLYENEILKWIEKCQSKSGVGNIANLNYALESYKDIVQIITEKKESKMNIVDFFKDSRDFEIAFEIINNINEIADRYLKQVADNLDKLLKEEWIVEIKQLDRVGKNNTQNAIIVAEKKFMNDTKPFFYFCIFWYEQSRFYCNVYLETNISINDKINDIVLAICADTLAKPTYFNLERIEHIQKDFSGDKEYGNNHIINADKIAFNFIKNESKKIRQLNEKIRELYL